MNSIERVPNIKGIKYHLQKVVQSPNAHGVVGSAGHRHADHGDKSMSLFPEENHRECHNMPSITPSLESTGNIGSFASLHITQ